MSSFGLYDDVKRFSDALEASSAFATFCGITPPVEGDPVDPDADVPANHIFRWRADRDAFGVGSFVVVAPGSKWNQSIADSLGTAWHTDSEIGIMFDQVVDEDDPDNEVYDTIVQDVDDIMADLKVSVTSGMREWYPDGDSPERGSVQKVGRHSVRHLVFVGTNVWAS